MSETKNWKQESRGNWTSQVDNGTTLSDSRIQLGAILRIADSMELMAKDRLQMERDLAWYRDGYRRQEKEIQHLKNRINGLKGANTKLRNKK